MKSKMVTMKLKFKDGRQEIFHLDKQGIEQKLAEMEKWGDECPDEYKVLRNALKNVYSECFKDEN